MEKTNQKELKGKQFRWSSPMERLMLKVLAEEANKGNKPSSRFKHGSLEKAAKAISEKFHVDCVPDHVENRLKTVKKTWTTITTLKEKAGFSWDANSRMVIAGKDEFDEEVSAHPSYEKLLNKKIEMYDEMALVVGKDFTPGCFAKSVGDTVMDDNKVDSVHVEEESSSAQSIQAAPSIQATPRKRNHSSISEGNQIKELSKQIGKMAKALKVLSENQFVDVKKLFEEVMKCDGFSDNVLGSAFDFLVENEKQAKAFMVKTMNLRKSWLEGFESRMKN